MRTGEIQLECRGTITYTRRSRAHSKRCICTGFDASGTLDAFHASGAARGPFTILNYVYEYVSLRAALSPLTARAHAHYAHSTEQAILEIAQNDVRVYTNCGAALEMQSASSVQRTVRL